MLLTDVNSFDGVMIRGMPRTSETNSSLQKVALGSEVDKGSVSAGDFLH
jgi:hypothetical protein